LRFLHAYFVIDFRAKVGHKQPALTLVSLVVGMSSKLTYPYSGFSVLPYRVSPDITPGKHPASATLARRG